MNQAYQGIVYEEKPFQGLRNLSVICTILGYLSFFGGFILGFAASAEAYDPTLPFLLGLSVGFTAGIGYLITAEVIKLFIAAKENLQEILSSTKEIAAHLKETATK